MKGYQPLKFFDSRGLLRPAVYGFKLLFKDPIQLIKELIEDFKNDINPRHKGIIICLGLPKSGTTLIEEILLKNGSIDGTRSLLRRISYLPKDIDPHSLHENLIKFFPINKSTFIKTHSPHTKENIEIISKFNLDYFISVRDPRQMMLSRYYHILNNSKHIQHNTIKNLNKLDGFKKSLFSETNEIHPIDEYSNWLNDHIKNTNKILKYEEFVNDKYSYLKNLSKFSGVKLNIERTINSIEKRDKNLKKNFGYKGRKKSTFRKGKTDEWKHIFDLELTNLFKKKFGDILIKLEYEKNYEW